jgi:O-antigen ligase
MTALGSERLPAAVGRSGVVALGAAGLGIAAVTSPTYALAGVLGVGFVVAAFRSLALGCALFALLIFFGQLGSGGGIKAAGAVLVLAWLVRMGRERNLPFLVRDHPVVAFAAAGFVLLGMASSIWAESPGAAFSASIRVGLGVVLVFVLYAAVDNRRRLQIVLGGVLLGAFVSAIVGLVSGTPTDTTSTVEDANRLAGQVGDANTFAAILVPALMISAFWAGITKSTLTRFALSAGAAVFAFALFLTGSRGGLVALGVCFVATLFLAGPFRARAIAVMTVVAALAVTYYALLAPPQALARITHFAAGGGAGRTDLWSVAIKMFGAHPVLGIGAGNFQIVEAHYAFGSIDLPRVDLVLDTPKVAHNTYLQVLTELGVVGFVAFMIVIAGTVWVAWRSVRVASEAGDVELEALSRGILIGTLGMLAAIVFFTAHTEKELWLMLGVVLSLSTLASRTSRMVALPAYDRRVQDDVAEALERRLDERLNLLLAEQERLTRRRSQLTELERQLRARTSEPAAREPRAPDHRAPDPRGADLDEREAKLDERERACAEREAKGLELAKQVVRERQELEQLRIDAMASAAAAPEPSATGEADARRLAELEAQLREARAASERLAPLEEELAAARQELERLRPLVDELSAVRAELAELREAAQAVAAVPPAETAGTPDAAGPTRGGEEEAGAYTLPGLEELVRAAGAAHPDRVEDWNAYLFFLRDYAGQGGTLPASFNTLIDDVFGDLLDP